MSRENRLAYNQEMREFDRNCIKQFEVKNESQCKMWNHSLNIKLNNLLTHSEFEIDYETDRSAWYREALQYNYECNIILSDTSVEILSDSTYTSHTTHGFLCDTWFNQLAVRIDHFYKHASAMTAFDRDDAEGWLAIEIDQFGDRCF